MKRFSWKRGLLFGVFCLWLWGAVGVAGPWKGQVVDGDTGKPLEGVVLLTSWSKLYRTAAGLAGGGYYTSQEVVTGPDGSFTIARQWTFTPTPGWSVVRESPWVIFMPGYGQWCFRGDKIANLPPAERLAAYDKQFDEYNHWLRQQWEKFEREGAVIELSPLKTREERLKYFNQGGITPAADVPKNARTHFDEAYSRERQFLGFGR